MFGVQCLNSLICSPASPTNIVSITLLRLNQPNCNEKRIRYTARCNSLDIGIVSLELQGNSNSLHAQLEVAIPFYGIPLLS